MKTGVYQIINLNNMKSYVGSAANPTGIRKRKTRHLNDLRRGIHSNPHLQNAFKKHGEDSFIFFPLEFCPPEKCVEQEQFWMNLVKPEYNISPTAGSTLGVKQTDETKRKQGNLSRERWKNPDYRKKVSKSRQITNATPEYKKIQSIRTTDRWKNPEYRKQRLEDLEKRWTNPDHNEKHSKFMETLWGDPEWKENNGVSKLSIKKVIEIRRLWNEMSPRIGLQAQLARVFNVCDGSISNIVKRRTWKHLPEE